jgi:catecholate siderophore receptor
VGRRHHPQPGQLQHQTKTAAIYGFDTLKFGDKWLLNLGIRYDDYQTSGLTTRCHQRQRGDHGVTYHLAQGRVETSSTTRPAWSTSRPRSSLYVSYGTASTPPGIAGGDQNSNGFNGTGNLANPAGAGRQRKLRAGAKVNVFNDALALSAALFKTTRKNAQIQIDAGVYAQVGETQVQGVELGVSGNITPKWQAFGGYTYMDSELVRGAYNGVNQGDPLANTPKNTFSLFTTYRVTRPLSLGGGAYYVSKSFGGNQGGAGGGANKVYAAVLLALRRLRQLHDQRQGRPAAERPEPDRRALHHQDQRRAPRRPGPGPPGDPDLERQVLILPSPVLIAP